MHNLSRLVAVSATAAALTLTGWAATTALAGAAPAPSAASVAGPVTAQDVWVDWKVYSTHEKCRQAGRDMIGVGAVVDYKCEWDSPGWMLSLRMVG